MLDLEVMIRPSQRSSFLWSQQILLPVAFVNHSGVYDRARVGHKPLSLASGLQPEWGYKMMVKNPYALQTGQSPTH